MGHGLLRGVSSLVDKAKNGPPVCTGACIRTKAVKALISVQINALLVGVCALYRVSMQLSARACLMA